MDKHYRAARGREVARGGAGGAGWRRLLAIDRRRLAPTRAQ